MKADVGATTSNGSGAGSSGGSAALARCVVLCPRSNNAAPELPAELRGLLAPRASSVACFDEPLRALAEMVMHERGFAGGEHKDPMLLILVEPGRLPQVEPLIGAMSKYAHRAAVWQYDPASARRFSRYVAPVSAPTHGSSNGHTSSAPAAGVKPRTIAAAAPAFVSWVGMPGNLSGGLGGGVSGGSASSQNAPRPAPRLRLAGEASSVVANGNPAQPTTTSTANGHPVNLAPPVPTTPTPISKARPELTDEEMAMLLGDTRPGPGGTKP